MCYEWVFFFPCSHFTGTAELPRMAIWNQWVSIPSAQLGVRKGNKRREEGKIKERGKEKGSRKMKRVVGDILCIRLGIVDY